MKGIWVPTSAAVAQQKKVDSLANNVANLNTPGFKKDQLIFKEYMVALDKGLEDIDIPRGEFSPQDFYHSQGGEHSFVKVDGSYTQFQQGQLTPTHSPLDFPIRGPGFFEILTPNGIRYSRNGHFTISTQGELVNSQGNRVLAQLDETLLAQTEIPEGEDPSPSARTINVKSGKISVNQQGQIFLDSKPIGTLAVVEFKDSQALKKVGNSLYSNADNNNIVLTEKKSKVHQGFIEQSNVNAIAEMSELIKANRQFESIQRVIKAYDSLAGKSSSEILKF